MKKYLYPLILLTISILIVFYNFPNYPKNIAHDETEIVRAALTLVNKPFTIFTQVADGHTTLYLYTLLGSFNLFGFNNFAMRLPVAVCTVMNVLFLYLILVKVLKNSKFRLEIGLLSSFLMLTSHWFINFGRFSFEIPFLLTLELFSLYLIISGQIILSAIFAGLAFNSYQPGRIFFVIPLFYLLINKYYKQISKFLIIFVLMILPLSFYLMTNSSSDIRINQQLYFKNEKLTIDQKLGYFSTNVVKNLGMFSFVGDNNGRHNYPGKPALNPVLAILMYLGMLIVILNIRKNNFHKLFLVYFIVALFPTLLTLPIENPNMLRTYTLLPSMFYFVAVSLNALFHLKEKSWGKYQNLIIFIILFLLIISTYKELKTYFVDQGQVFKKAFEYSKSIDQIYRYK